MKNELEPLSDDLRALLRDAREPPLPPDDFAERVLRRAQATLAAPAGSSTDVPAAAPAAVASKLGSWGAGLAAATFAAGAATGFVAGPRRAAPPPPPIVIQVVQTPAPPLRVEP